MPVTRLTILFRLSCCSIRQLKTSATRSHRAAARRARGSDRPRACAQNWVRFRRNHSSRLAPLTPLTYDLTPLHLWIANAASATADRDGVFYPLALPEAYVRKGMSVGYLTDYFGDKLSEVPAPVSG